MFQVYFMYFGGKFYGILLIILCIKQFHRKKYMWHYTSPQNILDSGAFFVSGFQIKDTQSVILCFWIFKEPSFYILYQS